MVRAVSGALIGALLFCGIPNAGQSRDRQDETLGKAAATLTSDSPSASIPVDVEMLSKAPPILALTITKVVNPKNVGLGVSVYLSYLPPTGSAGTEARRKKILVGNFSLYPSIRASGFLLRTSEAFSKLRAAGAISQSSDVRLLLEMKRIHEKKPWSHVELVVAPLEWRQRARK